MYTLMEHTHREFYLVLPAIGCIHQSNSILLGFPTAFTSLTTYRLPLSHSPYISLSLSPRSICFIPSDIWNGGFTF